MKEDVFVEYCGGVVKLVRGSLRHQYVEKIIGGEVGG